MISVPLKDWPSSYEQTEEPAASDRCEVAGRCRSFGRGSGTSLAAREEVFSLSEEFICLKTLRIRRRPTAADGSTPGGMRCSKICCGVRISVRFTVPTSRRRCSAPDMPFCPGNLCPLARRAFARSTESLCQPRLPRPGRRTTVRRSRAARGSVVRPGAGGCRFVRRRTARPPPRNLAAPGADPPSTTRDPRPA